jgi:hypothetical protein
MEWQIIIAILIAIPIILFPIALIWYLNLGGVITAIKESKSRRAIREKEGKTAG